MATAGAWSTAPGPTASLANDVFVRYTERIVAELGRRYGRDPRVWGWQLDNEPYGPADYSPSARRKFQAWLERKYGAIERMNEAWGGAFWSTKYDSFAQVLIPNEGLFGEDALSPHAVLDFRRFTADTQAEFLHLQYDILRGLVRPEQWITTNYMNVTGSADPRRTDRLDFLSFTMYPVRGRRTSARSGSVWGILIAWPTPSTTSGRSRGSRASWSSSPDRSTGPASTPSRSPGPSGCGCGTLSGAGSRSPAPTGSVSRSSAASSTTPASSGRTGSRRRGAAWSSPGSSPR